jgi:hypothetical protein
MWRHTAREGAYHLMRITADSLGADKGFLITGLASLTLLGGLLIPHRSAKKKGTAGMQPDRPCESGDL